MVGLGLVVCSLLHGDVDDDDDVGGRRGICQEVMMIYCVCVSASGGYGGERLKDSFFLGDLDDVIDVHY